MITKKYNGVLVAELGKGTLHTAVAFSNGTPVGLAFTNNSDGTLGENSIILQITTVHALASYMDLTMRYLKEIVISSGEGFEDVESMVKSIKEFQDSIEHMLPKGK